DRLEVAEVAARDAVELARVGAVDVQHDLRVSRVVGSHGGDEVAQFGGAQGGLVEVEEDGVERVEVGRAGGGGPGVEGEAGLDADVEREAGDAVIADEGEEEVAREDDELVPAGERPPEADDPGLGEASVQRFERGGGDRLARSEGAASRE